MKKLAKENYKIRHDESLKSYEYRIAQAANRLYFEASDKFHSALDSARECGRALDAAFRTLGRGKWGEWVEANFKGSPRSARDYRRIYLQWNSATLKRAREESMDLSSINKVLTALRKTDDGARTPRTKKSKAVIESGRRRSISAEFSKCSARMSELEQRILNEDFNYFWQVLRKEIRQINTLYEECSPADKLTGELIEEYWDRQLLAYRQVTDWLNCCDDCRAANDAAEHDKAKTLDAIEYGPCDDEDQDRKRCILR